MNTVDKQHGNEPHQSTERVFRKDEDLRIQRQFQMPSDALRCTMHYAMIFDVAGWKFCRRILLSHKNDDAEEMQKRCRGDTAEDNGKAAPVMRAAIR